MSTETVPVSVKALFTKASRLQSAGALDEADSLYRDILAENPQHADSLNQIGVISHLRGRHEDAITLIRGAMALFPGAAPLYFNCALAAKGAGRSEEAARLYQQASHLMPGNADMLCNLGNIYQSLSRPAEAEAVYRRALQSAPQSARVHYNLALALKAQGDRQASQMHYRIAVILRPDYADALANLGSESLERGELAAATRLLLQATKFDRPAAEMQFNLGELHRAQKQSEAAIDCYRRSLVLDPSLVEPGASLNYMLHETGRLAEAAQIAWRMMMLRPTRQDTHTGLADTLLALGALADAGSFYRKAIALNPELGNYNNLANAERSQGFLDEAIITFTHGLACNPDDAVAHSNMLFTLLYRPQTRLPDMLAAAVAWNVAHGRPDSPRPAVPADLRRTPRIGFISDDFRGHVVANLVIPTIETLHRRDHDLTIYSTNSDRDPITDRFIAASSRFHHVPDLEDDGLERLIREDGIDILIELSGHTAGNRLKALSRRLAPLQASWIGYPATTGVPAIDYFLADRRQVPDEAEPYFSEKIIRFPHSYVCYEPVGGVPDRSPSPFLNNGFITFGSFNESVKITNVAIEAWARVLDRVPESRFLFKTGRLDDPGTRKVYAARMAKAGIDLGRVDFMGRTTGADHVAAMGKVDIALDTFPYTGGATTLETLWMGVPIVALPGDTMASRHVLGYLGCLDLNDFVASSVDDYVEIAVALAEDRPRLRSLREMLRIRMTMSPLCDRHRFAAAFEAAIDGMWQRYCAGEPPASFDVPAS